MDLSLDSNITISVDAFTCTKTYLSILSLTIPGYTNEILLRGLRVPRDWGERKLLVLKPTPAEMKSVLPPFVYFLWLTSDFKVNDEDYSELVVAFFAQSPEIESLKQLFQSKLLDLDWRLNSTGCSL